MEDCKTVGDIIKSNVILDLIDKRINARINNKLKELNNIDVKIFTKEGAKIPTRAHDDDYGYDIYAYKIEYDYNRDRYIVHTGIHVEIPEGYAIHIYPRSSLSKTEFYIPNAPGIVDAGYRGEILVVFKCRTNNCIDKDWYDVFPFKEGDRIAQMNIVKSLNINFIEVKDETELSNTERGNYGYGSTGK